MCVLFTCISLLSRRDEYLDQMAVKPLKLLPATLSTDGVAKPARQPEKKLDKSKVIHVVHVFCMVSSTNYI